MALNPDPEQFVFLDTQWKATKEDEKQSPQERLKDENLINWVEGFSSGKNYRLIWWDGEIGEVLKVVFQDPDILHIASLYPAKLTKEVAEGKRSLRANNLIVWALNKLREGIKNPQPIKHVLFYCIADENLGKEQFKKLIDAKERTDQFGLLTACQELKQRGLIAAAIRSFGEPIKLHLGGPANGAKIVIDFK